MNVSSTHPTASAAATSPRLTLIDTHCHLHDCSAYEFALSRNLKCNPADYAPDSLIQAAHDQGITQMICIGTTHADSLAARDFATAHPGEGVFWSYGIHPEEAGADDNGDNVSALAPAPIAIGEVGLDYHTPGHDRPAQIRLLEEMLDLARRHDLPLIFHVRDAFADFWPIIDNAHVQRAVVHSFSDSTANLTEALNRDFYIGINGLATFAHLYADSLSVTKAPLAGNTSPANTPASPAPLPPLDRILLETDAPFLAPVPHRGLPNQPAYVRDVAVWLAATLQSVGTLPADLTPAQALVEVARITTQNARTLFPGLAAS